MSRIRLVGPDESDQRSPIRCVGSDESYQMNLITWVGPYGLDQMSSYIAIRVLCWRYTFFVWRECTRRIRMLIVDEATIFNVHIN